MQKPSRWGGLIWLSVYIGLLAGIAVGMLKAHDKLEADSRRDQASWTAFREDTAQKARSKRGPAEHPVPPSDEPPMLVLMRDHFPMMFIAAIVFPAIILGFLMLAMRGAMRQAGAPKADEAKPQDEAKPPEMNGDKRELKKDEGNPEADKPDDAKPDDAKPGA